MTRRWAGTRSASLERTSELFDMVYLKNNPRLREPWIRTFINHLTRLEVDLDLDTRYIAGGAEQRRPTCGLQSVLFAPRSESLVLSSRLQVSVDASPRRGHAARREAAVAEETCVPLRNQGSSAATASISTSHSGIASAGTMIAVDAGRTPPSAFLRAAA